MKTIISHSTPYLSTLIFLILSNLNINIILSQVTEQWVATYNGPANDMDYAAKIVLDRSGNIYVTGPSVGIGTNMDYTTIKYNSNGIQLWAARYNGPGNQMDMPTAMAIDSSGNIYVTGYSNGNSSLDYCTIKYNNNGVQQWVARYPGSGTGGAANSIAVDANSNIYVTGTYNYNLVTIKYNTNGVQQWVATYITNNNDGNYWYEFLDNYI
jgi:hypothetical protein